jgi:predicted transcriptional regulator
MARPKVKDAEARTFRIRKDIGARLDDYSELSHIPKTVIVELALEEYLNKVAPAEKTEK